MASKIEELLRRLIGGGFQEQNIISGEVLPRNVISGRIADRPIDTITSGEMAEIDKVGMGVPFRGIKAPPGRGLEPRFGPPTGRQPLLPEFPITPDIADRPITDTARVPEILPDTGKAPGGFDWDRFIEVMGTVGAGLAPRGPFAKAGLAAAADVKERRAREAVTVKTAAEMSDTERRTRVSEINTEISQARLDFAISKDERDLERALTLEREKSGLRIAEEEAKRPAKVAKAEAAEARRGKTATQQRKNRIRTAKNSVMSAIRRHDRGTEDIPQFIGLTPKQIKRVMEIIRKLDITGDETTDEIIQMAADLLGIETDIPTGHDEVSAGELLGPIEETTDFITDEELLRR